MQCQRCHLQLAWAEEVKSSASQNKEEGKHHTLKGEGAQPSAVQGPDCGFFFGLCQKPVFLGLASWKFGCFWAISGLRCCGPYQPFIMSVSEPPAPLAFLTFGHSNICIVKLLEGLAIHLF